MRKVLLILFLSTMANCLYAHVDETDEKGGHWYHRLGIYHQHYDFRSPKLIAQERVDGTYDWSPDDSYDTYRMRFFRLGIRTYQIDKGKHAFGIQSALQLNSEFDYGRQWSLGVNYRRRYSVNTTITYEIDYYRANQFNIVDYTVWWGIYVPQISKKWSLHAGLLLSTALEASDFYSSIGALSYKLEWDTGIAILTFRYDSFGTNLSIFSSGLTYKF